jgi:hypothetical protein
MKHELLKEGDARITNSMIDFFTLTVDKDKLVRKFGEPTNKVWNLLITFEAIGNIVPNEKDSIMFSIKEENINEFSISSNVNDKDFVFQFFRKKKLC